MAGQKQIRVVIESFDLMKGIASEPGITAPQLQQAVGFTRDKTYRMLATLIAVGAVEERGSGKYELSRGIADLWCAFRDNLDRKIDRLEKEKLETE